jgi:hypothetical protein
VAAENRVINKFPIVTRNCCLFLDFITFIVIVSLLLSTSACSKEPVREKKTDPDTSKVASYAHGIFILNEGNYNWNNASVTFLDKTSHGVVQDIFAKANNRPLGDVAQSMTIAGNLGYILINNSNRIEVVTLANFKSVNTISGLHLPRYMQLVDSTRAYVTNLHNYISIINLNTNTVTGTIKTTGWTESLVRYDKYMLVASMGNFSKPSAQRRSQILFIDTATDVIVDSLQTGKEPVGVIMDKYGKVWVLCSGGYDYFEAPSLLRINPGLRVVEKVFTFTDAESVPGRLCMNPGGDTISYLMGGVFRMPVTATGLPLKPLISADNRLLYGLNIHPVTGHIYVSDVKDYIQNGTAYEYSASGNLVAQFTTGRIPGSFCFTTDRDK